MTIHSLFFQSRQRYVVRQNVHPSQEIETDTKPSPGDPYETLVEDRGAEPGERLRWETLVTMILVLGVIAILAREAGCGHS